MRRFDIYFIPFQTKMGSEISAEEIKEEEKVEEEVKVEPSKAAEPKHKTVFLTPEEAAVPSKVGDEELKALYEELKCSLRRTEMLSIRN